MEDAKKRSIGAAGGEDAGERSIRAAGGADAGKRIIGVTGGVGAGKSKVLKLLREEFGARLILADLVAHDLMEPGKEGYREVIKALGAGFLSGDGSVDRQKLADLIFHDEAALRAMNAIIHPMAWSAIVQEALEAAEELVVVEAAVFDTAPSGFFDEIWYVYAPEETRITRLMENRGYTREKCESIIRKQEPEGEYRRRCSRVIDNGGAVEETREQLKEILKR